MQLDSVRPRKASEIAAARRSAGTSWAATTALRPKTAPCGRAVITRAAKSVPKLGASALAMLPSTNSVISDSSSARRGAFAPIAIISGAPTTTPSA